MLCFETLNAERQRIEKQLDEAEKHLKSVIGNNRLPNGLTSDEVKSSYQYQVAKAEYNKVFASYQNINRTITKHFKKENRAYHMAKRKNKMAKTKG